MCQHSGALERKWNRQLTRSIFPVGVKSLVWGRDYHSMPDSRVLLLCGTTLQVITMGTPRHIQLEWHTIYIMPLIVYQNIFLYNHIDMKVKMT